MRAGGPQHIGFDGGGDQVALPLENRGDDQAVGLEGAGWAEGQDRVALFDGQIQATQQPVSNAVAAAQDDPSPAWAEHEEAAQLPPTRPLRPVLLAPAAGPRGQQPDQQPIGKAGSQKVSTAAAYMPTGPGSSG